MKVLIITGDKRFGPGHPRYELQRGAVEELGVLYWRGGSWSVPVSGRFDIVTAQDPFWRGLVAWHIARGMGARFNVQVHTDLGAQSLMRRALAQIVLRHADSVRVVSQMVKQQVEHMGVRAPITVLPVFVELEKFKSITPVPHEQKTILWMGRFENEKDPLLALEVLKGVPGAKLVMLGSGNLERTLHEQAKGLAVEFPGWQHPVRYLAEADVVLSTSRHESWGESIVESLAAGVAVVAPDVGVAREAGATIKARSDLALGVVEVLRSGQRGALALHLLGAEEWAKQWRASL